MSGAHHSMVLGMHCQVAEWECQLIGLVMLTHGEAGLVNNERMLTLKMKQLTHI